MRTRTVRLMIVLPALALALSLRAQPARAAFTFSVGYLRSYWVFQMTPAKSFAANAPGDPGGVATAPRQNVLRVGYIHWDGAGGASGRTIATTDDNSGNTVVIDYTWTGAYTVNPDGTGTLNVTSTAITDANCTPAQLAGVCATLEGPETYALVINKGAGVVSLNETDNVGGAKIFMTGQATRQWNDATQFPFTPKALRSAWTFQLRPATSFAASAPGDPGGVATAPRQDILRVGVIQWDGVSGVTGHVIATTDDNFGNTVIIDYGLTGNYTMSSDGTGTLSVVPIVTDTSCTPAQAPGICATFEGNETYAFALSKRRVRLYLTETDNVGRGAKIFMTGEAGRQ